MAAARRFCGPLWRRLTLLLYLLLRLYLLLALHL